MSDETSYRIAPEGRHTLVGERAIYYLDFSDAAYDDPDSRGAVQFLRRVGLVQAAAIAEETRSQMGFGTSRDDHKALPDTILRELHAVTWIATTITVDGQLVPAVATTYRGLDFIFLSHWPPREIEFTIHRPAGPSPATDWPGVTTSEHTSPS